MTENSIQNHLCIVTLQCLSYHACSSFNKTYEWLVFMPVAWARLQCFQKRYAKRYIFQLNSKPSEPFLPRKCYPIKVGCRKKQYTILNITKCNHFLMHCSKAKWERSAWLGLKFSTLLLKLKHNIKKTS